MVKLVLKEDTSVTDVLQLLDNAGVGILPVVDNHDKLIGIVTDGDVRRAILHQNFDVEHIINKNPQTLFYKTSKVEILRTLKARHLRHMPLIDEDRRLRDIVFLENLHVERKPNKVVIMAGGLGTRLGELTQETPKPMLPVAGRPILEHIIESMKFQGFFDFVLCLNYKSSMIQTYFGNGEKFGVTIQYTIENKRLGTAGALSLIDQRLLDKPVLVLNADVLSHIDLDEVMRFHMESNADATMCVKPQAYEIPYACVEFDEDMNIKSLVEKPKVDNYINAGIYVLNPAIISLIPQDEFFDMPSLFHQVMQQGYKAKIFKFDDYWIDIGRPSDYTRANTDME